MKTRSNIHRPFPFYGCLLVIPICLFGLTPINAQETVLSSGGNATGGGSVSYSVGQIVYNAYPGTNDNSEAQGVQQPYESSIETGPVGIAGNDYQPTPTLLPIC